MLLINRVYNAANPLQFLERHSNFRETAYMKDKISPRDNAANMQNPNKGTSGTNKQYDQNQGNRGAQMQPNQNTKGSTKKDK